MASSAGVFLLMVVLVIISAGVAVAARGAPPGSPAVREASSASLREGLVSGPSPKGPGH